MFEGLATPTCLKRPLRSLFLFAQTFRPPGPMSTTPALLGRRAGSTTGGRGWRGRTAGRPGCTRQQTHVGGAGGQPACTGGRLGCCVERPCELPDPAACPCVPHCALQPSTTTAWSATRCCGGRSGSPCSARLPPTRGRGRGSGIRRWPTPTTYDGSCRVGCHMLGSYLIPAPTQQNCSTVRIAQRGAAVPAACRAWPPHARVPSSTACGYGVSTLNFTHAFEAQEQAQNRSAGGERYSHFLAVGLAAASGSKFLFAAAVRVEIRSA